MQTTAATEYGYDAESRRVAKGSWTGITWPTPGHTSASGAVPSCATPTTANGSTLTAVYLHGSSGGQDVEIDPGVGSNPAGWHQNVFADGGLMATYTEQGGSAPALFFNFNDWLGTKRLQVNAAGQAVNYWATDPFGDYFTPHVLGSDPTEHHFTGKERDAESGNDYFGARYYASSMGRFQSPDWSDEPMAVPYGDLENPQSLNLYSYVNNNPLSNVDDDGHVGCPGGVWQDVVCIVQGAINGIKSLFSGGSGSSNNNGDTGPSVAPTPDPNFTPQLHTRPTPSPNQGGGINNQAFANYMDSHAQPHSTGYCARACRMGMEAGGMNTNGRPGDAKNYGPFLLQHGYHEVPGASYFGNQQVGDVAVMQPAPGHSQSGHIEMWDGHQWVSDFKQRNFSPYSGLAPSDLNFKIYRQGNQ